MLYSTTPRSGARSAAISARPPGDVTGVRARMHGDAARAGVEADLHRLENRRRTAAARVAERGDLVDVDGEADHVSVSSRRSPDAA